MYNICSVLLIRAPLTDPGNPGSQIRLAAMPSIYHILADNLRTLRYWTQIYIYLITGMPAGMDTWLWFGCRQVSGDYIMCIARWEIVYCKLLLFFNN